MTVSARLRVDGGTCKVCGIYPVCTGRLDSSSLEHDRIGQATLAVEVLAFNLLVSLPVMLHVGSAVKNLVQAPCML